MISDNVLTKQQRIAELACLHREVSFTSLAYHVDEEWLEEAYRRTRKDAVVGVDKVTAAEYEGNLVENLKSLLMRFKSGTYFAPPVKRVYTSVSRRWYTARGISPLLSNVYLHYVLDMWFEEEIKPLLKSEAQLIRYADDFVMLFKDREDALRLEKVIWRRFEKYGLALHPEKTRLIDFTPPAAPSVKSESFDFLGFTHFWSKLRMGNRVVKRKTAKKKLRRSIGATDQWCKENRHEEINVQYATLCCKLKGHYGFYGITFNSISIGLFYEQVKRCWKEWLNRRNRNNEMNWDTFNKLFKKYPLPRPRIVHSFA